MRRDKRMDSRCTTDTQYIQLSLVETHIAQRQTGKHTRGQDKDGNEADEDIELGIMRSVIAVTLSPDMQDTGIGRVCGGGVWGPRRDGVGEKRTKVWHMLGSNRC